MVLKRSWDSHLSSLQLVFFSSLIHCLYSKLWCKFGPLASLLDITTWESFPLYVEWHGSSLQLSPRPELHCYSCSWVLMAMYWSLAQLLLYCSMSTGLVWVLIHSRRSTGWLADKPCASPWSLSPSSRTTVCTVLTGTLFKLSL